MSEGPWRFSSSGLCVHGVSCDNCRGLLCENPGVAYGEAGRENAYKGVDTHQLCEFALDFNCNSYCLIVPSASRYRLQGQPSSQCVIVGQQASWTRMPECKGRLENCGLQ